MSLIIFLFYVAGIPLGIVLMGKRAFSRAENPVQKGIVVTLCIGMFTGLIWLAVGEKWLADRQVRKLCAKDGGIKVYETVSLSPDLLDMVGRISIPEKNRAKQTDNYFTETTHHYYKQGNPEVSRREYRIVRRSDKKVLGRLVFYGRGGGGLPGPWHESSFTCPKPSQIPNFESSIFIKAYPK